MQAGPPGDICDDAIAIACGTTESGTTTEPLPQNNGFCGTGGDTGAGGLWYTVDGNGFDYTASLCGSSFDTKMQVFSEHAALVCEDGSDDFCGLQSEVDGQQRQLATYYIYVYGFGTSNGAFDLALTCGAPCGDICDDVISIACDATDSGDTSTDILHRTTDSVER